MDYARKARSGPVWALGVFGRSVQCTNRDRTPKGTVYKLLGKELTWDDEPVELQTKTEKR